MTRMQQGGWTVTGQKNCLMTINHNLTTRNPRVNNQNSLIGCGIISVVCLIGLIIIVIISIQRERQSVQYPGSMRVSSHSNYSRFPFAFRWDDSFQTTDSFPSVYNWYSTNFNMGAEAEANGACILLEGNTERILSTRAISVLICETPKGRMAFVNQSVFLQ